MGLSTKIGTKDWERMQTLIRQEGSSEYSGCNVADKITDKDKALARFVAGIKLAGKTLNDFKQKTYPGNAGNGNYSSLPFLCFWEKARMLGCTPDEVEDLFNRTEVPEAFAAGNEQQKIMTANRQNIVSYDKFATDLFKKFDRFRIPVNVEMTGEHNDYNPYHRNHNSGQYKTYKFTLFPNDDFSKVALDVIIKNKGATVILRSCYPKDIAADMGLTPGMNARQIVSAVKKYLGM